MNTIEKALAAAKDLPKTRESALVITKLQEATYWLSEHQKVIAEKVAQHTGMGQKVTPSE